MVHGFRPAMAATLVGLQFSASLGKAWPPKQHGSLLIELDLTAARVSVAEDRADPSVQGLTLPPRGSQLLALLRSI